MLLKIRDVLVTINVAGGGKVRDSVGFKKLIAQLEAEGVEYEILSEGGR